jgi:predicted nucleotidyltransferase component of viral defense system
MIPQAFVLAWAQEAPWSTNEQVEQDLVICRALVEIFSDPFLQENLAFRGGTALHKLYLSPQPRYSEDIDLVQINAEPFGKIADQIRKRLAFLGTPTVRQKENNFTLSYRFETTFPPVQLLRLKIETNCREHFTVLGYQSIPFTLSNGWFKGSCSIKSYALEELLGTKIRALYQRSKGRDLYDLFKAHQVKNNLDIEKIIHCYAEYMTISVSKPPSKKLFALNLAAKMKDPDFTQDMKALLRPGEKYDVHQAHDWFQKEILPKMK